MDRGLVLGATEQHTYHDHLTLFLIHLTDKNYGENRCFFHFVELPRDNLKNKMGITEETVVYPNRYGSYSFGSGRSDKRHTPSGHLGNFSWVRL